MRDIRIDTRRFLLRSLVPDDATETYASWLDEPAAQRYIEAASREHGIAALRDYIAARCDDPCVLFLGIFTRDEGCHIGNLKYEPIDTQERYAVMGILVGEPAWRGVGTAAEVIKASAAWLRDELRIREVVLGVKRSNTPAVQAYARLGFVAGPTERIGPLSGEDLAMTWRL